MLRTSSFYFNVILMLISIIIFYQSLQIPVQDQWLSSPQIIPLSLSVIMFFIALILLIKEGMNKYHFKISPDSPISFLVFLIIIFFYLFVLGMVPFSIATFSFLLISFLYFKETSVWKSLLTAIGIVLFIVLVFENVFQIIFP